MKRALIVAQGILMVVAAFFIVAFIYTIGTSIFIISTGIQNIDPGVSYCLMVMAVMIAIILFFLWYRRYGRNGILETAEPKEIITLKNMGIYLMMGIGCQLFIAGALTLIRPLFETLFNYYDDTISSLFVADTIIVAMYVIVLAPIVEELMLRGILFNRLRYGISFMAANVIQAAVFGIYHWDIIQGIYAFGIGLLLGYIYEKSRTLIAPIIVHIIINGSGFLIQWLKLGPYLPIWLAIIIGGGLLFWGVYQFKKSTTFIQKI